MALIEASLKKMVERSVPVVFAEGPPDYYSRLGFSTGETQGTRKPSLRIADNALQAEPRSAYEPWMTGTLVYTDTFYRCDAVGLRDP